MQKDSRESREVLGMSYQADSLHVALVMLYTNFARKILCSN